VWLAIVGIVLFAGTALIGAVRQQAARRGPWRGNRPVPGSEPAQRRTRRLDDGSCAGRPWSPGRTRWLAGIDRWSGLLPEG